MNYSDIKCAVCEKNNNQAMLVFNEIGENTLVLCATCARDIGCADDNKAENVSNTEITTTSINENEEKNIEKMFDIYSDKLHKTEDVKFMWEQ